MPEVLPTQAPSGTLLLEPRRGWQMVNFRELWRYRELAYFFCWRDIKVRYKQTALGALWAVLQPVVSMVVFTLFFGRFLGLNKQTGGVSYPVFVYAGLLPWLLFSQTMTRGAESVLGSANLITKVYFPRLIVPFAAAGSCVVDFAVSLLVLAAMMIGYGIAPSTGILMTPVLIVLILLAALGVGTFLPAVIVAYRDFLYVVPFAVQIWMFVTPVIYPAAIVPEKWRWALWLNPMSGLVEGVRASLLKGAFDWPALALSTAIALAMFAAGVFYFGSVERRFADVI